MDMTPVPRPALRRATLADEHDLHALFCEPLVYRYLADGAPPPRTVTVDWIRTGIADFAHHGLGLWLLVEGDRPTGVLRLSGIEAATTAELTYALHPAVWGRGLASRMGHTALREAFVSAGLATVWACADGPNVASIEVMTRLGMRFRRATMFPLGPGVEYEITRAAFLPDRFTPLSLLD
jgi:RimJ/RimL family protein N-acetyltransferase